jgi:hypothetical protein
MIVAVGDPAVLNTNKHEHVSMLFSEVTPHFYDAFSYCTADDCNNTRTILASKNPPKETSTSLKFLGMSASE